MLIRIPPILLKFLIAHRTTPHRLRDRRFLVLVQQQAPLVAAIVAMAVAVRAGTAFCVHNKSLPSRARPCLAVPGLAAPSLATPGLAWPSRAVPQPFAETATNSKSPRHATPCQDMPSPAMPCPAMPCPAPTLYRLPSNIFGVDRVVAGSSKSIFVRSIDSLAP